MKTNKIVFVGLVSAFVAGGVFAEEYTLVSGFTDWNRPESYKTSSGVFAQKLPGREDTVLIPQEIASVTIDDNSIATVEAFKYLYPVVRSRNVKIIIDISTNATFRCYLNSWSKNSTDVTSHLVKKGKGTLRFGDVSQVTAPTGHYNYNTVMTIEEGMLVLPQNVIKNSNLYAGSVKVEKDALLFLSSPGNFRPESLKGSGIVTNDMSKSGTQLQPQDVNSCGEFSGVLAGNYNFGGNYYQYLTGKNNTFNGTVTITGSSYGKKASTLGVAKLGNINEPSSSGKNDKITFGEGSTAGSTGGGKLVYLGDGTLERSNKPLYFADTGYCPVTIDAGANGGLELEGAWTMSSAKMIRIVLDGSNTVNECSFLGAFNNKTSGDKTYTARITKKGTGIWRFGDNENRKNSGVIAVKEGTLRFDSIAEKGEVCSLGLSTDLHEDVSGEKPETTVPYAFLLGGGEKEGTMEYTGSRPGICSTRPFAVNGKGRISAKGSKLNLCGFTAYSSGTHTLTLDGDLDGNVLRNVTDGETGGILAVVKEGAGSWTLAGDQTFSGGISVNEGTLAIRRCASGLPFKWFRLVIKEIAYNSGNYTWQNPTWNNRAVRLHKFYLYDSSGNVKSSKLVYNENRFELGPNEVAWGFDTKPYPYNGNVSDNGVAKLFQYDSSWSMRVQLSYSPCMYGKPSTYLPIVMRLADSMTTEITGLNMKMDIAANADYCCEEPTAYSLEGSIDGVTWIMLTEDNEVKLPSVAKNTVYSPNRTFDLNPARTVADDKSFAAPISVSLGANATLRAEYVGEVEPIKISSLKVDSAGGSSCEGFIFEANGTLDVVNVTESSENGRFVAVNVSDDSGWANLKNWKITVNGKPLGGKFKVDIVENGLRISEPGFVLVVR